MGDLEKFYQLSKNIIDYPYDKAVCYREGRIWKIEIRPDSHFEHDTIIFFNYSDLKAIDVMLDGVWDYASTVEPNCIDYVIDQIKKKCNKEVQEALLEGIE